MNSLSNSSLIMALLLASCGAQTPSCLAPPYEDLSRWAPTPAELLPVCSVRTRAILDAAPATSTVLAKPYEGEAGAVVWVTAKILRLVGTGKLSTNIVNNYLLGIGGPDANGDAYVYARLPTGKATINFLGEAGAEPLRFEVRDVLVVPLEVAE